jgi:hypothetical protein
MPAQKASTHYDGSIPLPGKGLAGHEAVLPPGPSRAEVLRGLA